VSSLTFPNDVTPEAMLSALASERELRLWLDDDLEDRAAPDGWAHTTTVAQTVAALDTGRVIALSLDNDLGDDLLYGQGIHVIDFICQQQVQAQRLLWPREGITIHSANAVARDQMTRAINRYAGEVLRVHSSMTSGGKRHFAFQTS
jgi:hypothetical protein